MKHVVQSQGQGGSSAGYHHYKGHVTCGRRAVLDGEAREANEETSSDSTATGIGGVFHALREYADTPAAQRTKAVQFDCTEEERLEAERLNRAYEELRPAGFYGKVAGVEVTLPPPDADEATLERLHASVGIAPWTGKIDRAIKADAAACARIEKVLKQTYADFMLDTEITPGVYLHDYKTLGRWNKNSLESYTNDLQFAGYIVGWNACFPKTPCLGLIVDVVMKYKVPEVRTLFIPPPSADTVKALQHFYSFAAHHMTQLYNQPNPNACFNLYGTCSHFVSGACKRY